MSMAPAHPGDVMPAWPEGGVSRVPYRLFSDRDVYALEQERLFRGPVWNYLCLELEVAEPGDFRTAFIGETPIVVARDEQGELRGMVNRCAHKGALVCLAERGNRKHFLLHLPLLDLPSRRAAARRGLPGRAEGQGRHAGGFRPRPPPHAADPRRDILRPGLRHLRAGHAAGRGVGRAHHGAFPQAQSRLAPAEGARHPQPDHPQQLEALRRERPRFLPRHPAAHLLHHLQGEPAGHGRRHPALGRHALAPYQLRQAGHPGGGGGIQGRQGPFGQLRFRS